MHAPAEVIAEHRRHSTGHVMWDGRDAISVPLDARFGTMPTRAEIDLAYREIIAEEDAAAARAAAEANAYANRPATGGEVLSVLGAIVGIGAITALLMNDQKKPKPSL